ncbi:MAG: 4Fe-4S dicluster domain-containing protein [Euzebyales bacterium]|nr:4Fe-4S dicluster domain-containing protein [Euzebyales bacterium]
MTPNPTGAFDAFHPPDRGALDDCVHCGFCLPACPTYQLWGEEMDSPRGRIYLMDLASQGEIGLDSTFVQHMDACLGCMACVTACPSGVAYDRLIEDTRAQVERGYPRSRADRWFRAVIFALFPHPARLRVAAVLAWGYQRSGLRALVARSGLRDRLPSRLAALEQLLPDVRLRDALRRPVERVAAQGPSRRTVGMVTGCVQSVFFAEVNAATARVLAAEGCTVVAPREQQCCGALELHAGRDATARERAKRMIATMEEAQVDTVVINAAGCGSSLKSYGHLLADDQDWADRAAAFSAQVRDVTELLAELEPRAPRHPIRARVAYHDACHLAHAQGVRAEPRAVLAAIPGLELVEVAEPELCCGSAGIYNLIQPEAAADLGRRKAEHLRAADPALIATANPGCLLQIRRHLPDVPLLHPVQLVDASMRNLDPIATKEQPA